MADVLFINRLIKEKPGKLLLPGADISANRDEYRTRQDAIAEQSAPQDLLAPDNRVPYEPQLHELPEYILNKAVGVESEV